MCCTCFNASGPSSTGELPQPRHVKGGFRRSQPRPRRADAALIFSQSILSMPLKSIHHFPSHITASKQWHQRLQSRASSSLEAPSISTPLTNLTSTAPCATFPPAPDSPPPPPLLPQPPNQNRAPSKSPQNLHPPLTPPASSPHTSTNPPQPTAPP